MDLCRKYNRLREKIKDIRIALLTLSGEGEKLHNLPVHPVLTECEGYIWFFANLSVAQLKTLEGKANVNLAYSDPLKSIFVSIAGEAERIDDKQKMEDLWKPVMAKWFPAGRPDKSIFLVRVKMLDAEAWDQKECKMAKIWERPAIMRREKEEFLALGITAIIEGVANFL